MPYGILGFLWLDGKGRAEVNRDHNFNNTMNKTETDRKPGQTNNNSIKDYVDAIWPCGNPMA